MTASRIGALARAAWQASARHPNRVLVALAAMIVLSRVVLLTTDLNSRHHALISGAEQSAESYAAVLAEHTARTFEAVDRTLREAELIYRDTEAGRYATAAAVHDALRHLQQTSPLLIAIGWTNAAGDVEATSKDGAPARPNLADLPHFIAQRDSPPGGLSIAPPFRSIVTGNWITAAARRLEHPDGSFAGIVAATLDGSYFTGTYRSIGLDNGGAALLLHRDGEILAREPPVEGAIGRNISNSALMRRYLPRSEAGAYETTSAVDGTPRIVGYKAVAGLPLVVVVSYDRAEVLRPFYEHLRTYGLMAVLLIVLIALGTLVLMQQNRRIATKSNLLEVTLENMSQGLCMFDSDQRLIICNRHYAEMYGLAPEQTRPGTTLREVLEARVAAGQSPQDAQDYIERRLGEVSRSEPYYAVNRLRDGRAIAVMHQPRREGGWVAIHQDITAQKRVEAEIAHMARYDGLTDLGNRTLFMEKVDDALARLRRSGERFSIFMIDVDRFKGVNDSLGHPVGDALLKAVAQRLRHAIRDTDTVARLGGDEFAVLQTLVADQKESAVVLAERIIATVNEPYDLDGHKLSVGASIGIALAPDDGATAEQLLKNADLGLYRVKSGGRNGFRFFEPKMEAEARSRHALEGELRDAIAREEFELHYQTIVEFGTKDVCGAEALLRWRHPAHGLVGPDQFIPLAEETGLIVPLGEWTLRRACAEAARWPARIKLAVNLSPAQFGRGDIADVVTGALKDSGLAPERLELEITESVLLKQNENNLNTLYRLKELGVSIVLDDFGTGYASLTYLHMFPFDKIKIDKSFVHELSSSAECAAIVCAVVGLGGSLGIGTVAEGVETHEQFALLRVAGCRQAQGYLFSRPVPASELSFAWPETLRRSVQAA
ncbi:MAG TPA: EAL domain-containing protein [Xanthobacteraceae bacterium]|jgi:diguanylate cyclase (GGDEF)-like protein/PAS domain S-box-containing protein|nr:EAL domain-containing protein [Xanthobacteraceae bacterium]